MFEQNLFPRSYDLLILYVFNIKYMNTLYIGTLNIYIFICVIETN